MSPLLPFHISENKLTGRLLSVFLPTRGFIGDVPAQQRQRVPLRRI